MNIASMRMVFDLVPLVFLFFVPAITMRLLAEEKKSGTLELLTTKPVRDVEIVLGKFLAAWTLLAAALAPTLIYLVTLMVLGSPDLGPVFAGYLGLMLTGGVYIAIGHLRLEPHRKPDHRVPCRASHRALRSSSPTRSCSTSRKPWRRPWSIIAIDFHFSNIARGVIDSRDIVYFASLLGSRSCSRRRPWNGGNGEHAMATRTAQIPAPCSAIALVLAILVLVNIISIRIFGRLDMTRNQSFTLSEASKTLMRGLDDKVTVRAYFTEDLPAPYNNNRRACCSTS